MNIAFFTDTYFPQVNGVVTSVESFRVGLESMGHNVYVFAPKVKGYRDPLELKGKVFRFTSFQMKFMPSGNSFPNRLSLPFSLKAYLKLPDLKLDLVHSHTEFGLGQLANFVAATFRIPHLHTYHTIYPEYVHYLAGGKMISPRAAEKLSAFYCNACSGIVVPSDRIKNLLWKYGVKKPIEVIGTGIDLKKYEMGNRDAFRAKYVLQGSFVCLYVGRLGKEKKVDVAMRCFAKAKIPNKKLLLVGGGPYKPELEQLAKELNILDKVVFAGIVRNDEIADAYAAGDVFTFASQSETQGLVVLEAEAAGLPVAAWNDATMVEYVKNDENGYMANSEAEFSQAIEKIAADKKLRGRFSAASKKISADFSFLEQSQKLLKVYENIIS